MGIRKLNRIGGVISCVFVAQVTSIPAWRDAIASTLHNKIFSNFRNRFS